MHLPFYIWFIAISFIAGLTVYFRNNSPGYLKLFPLYLLATLVVEIIATSSFTYDHASRNRIYNFFSVFEFVFYYFQLYQILQNNRIKQIILFTGLLYPLIALINILFIQGTELLHSFTLNLGTFTIVVFCGYYFYELLKKPVFLNLVREPAFWICCGLLSFYGGLLPLWAALPFMMNFSETVLKGLSLYLYMINCILYSLFAVAFLCNLKVQKKNL